MDFAFLHLSHIYDSGFKKQSKIWSHKNKISNYGHTSINKQN